MQTITEKENTLQSIDNTLKRIEAILLERKKPLRDIQNAVKTIFSERSEER